MRDVKELKEMICGITDHDEDVVKEIEELKAEIDRMIKGLNEISLEQKVIMEKIRNVLDEHELKYSYDEDEPKHLGLDFGMENKPLKIHIILQKGKVIFKLSFPFRVQSNAIPLASVFSAGSATAAMMPAIIEICNGSIGTQSDWIAVAYAVAICVGSSLFMWSTTAGFILSGKVNDARIETESEEKISWGVGQYLKYGFLNYAIQLGIALVTIAIVF